MKCLAQTRTDLRQRWTPMLLVGAAALALAPALAPPAHGQNQVVFSQPPEAAGGLIKSSWYPPDGLDGDAYAFDSFVLGANQAITEIDWRGGYTNFLSGAGESPVYDFTIAIYASIAAGIQPDVVAPPLVRYSVGGNAGETLAGTFGGVPMYDYRFVLPTAFQTTGGTKYWVQIEASQGLTPVYSWPPDWSIAFATGGDGSHFQATTGGTAGGGTLYQILSSDLAFTLLGPVGPSPATPTGTPTSTPTPPPTTTATPSATATAASQACTGDCSGNQAVTVDEIVTMVNVALGNAGVITCPAGDANGDGQVTVDEIVTAVNNALDGCLPPNPEQACLSSGGTVSMALCCLGTGDFPDSCAIGPCGCSPSSSHEVRVCSCGAGKCFGGAATGCVAH